MVGIAGDLASPSSCDILRDRILVGYTKADPIYTETVERYADDGHISITVPLVRGLHPWIAGYGAECVWCTVMRAPLGMRCSALLR